MENPEVQPETQTPVQYGIQETAEMALFIAHAGYMAYLLPQQGMKAVMNQAVPIIAEGIAAVSNAGSIPKELADLTEQEIADIRIFVKRGLNLPSTTPIDALIDKTITATLYCAEAWNEWSAFLNKKQIAEEAAKPQPAIPKP